MHEIFVNLAINKQAGFHTTCIVPLLGRIRFSDLQVRGHLNILFGVVVEESSWWKLKNATRVENSQSQMSRDPIDLGRPFGLNDIN